MGELSTPRLAELATQIERHHQTVLRSLRTALGGAREAGVLLIAAGTWPRHLPAPGLTSPAVGN
jgi:hypothetical protein